MQSAIWQTFWQSWGRFGTILRHNWGFSSYFLFGIAFVINIASAERVGTKKIAAAKSLGRQAKRRLANEKRQANKVASKKAAGKRKAASE
ncbi:MAG: hypothetical protein IKK27_03695 [Alistipes sp.]|nr:hypothetical protein [Alistipes sp.]